VSEYDLHPVGTGPGDRQRELALAVFLHHNHARLRLADDLERAALHGVGERRVQSLDRLFSNLLISLWMWMLGVFPEIR